MSKFPISPKAIATYPGGTKELSPKQQGEASKKARMKVAPKGSGNLAEDLNDGAIEAAKNNHGLPLGNQKFKTNRPLMPRYRASTYEDGTDALSTKTNSKRIKLQKKVAKHKDDYETSPETGVTRKTLFGKKAVSGKEANEVFSAGYLKKENPKTESSIHEVNSTTTPKNSAYQAIKVSPTPNTENSAAKTEVKGATTETKVETLKVAPAPKKSGYIKFSEMSGSQKKAYRAGIASGKDFSVEGIGKYKGAGSISKTAEKTPVKSSVSITTEGPKKEDVDAFIAKTNPQPLSSTYKKPTLTKPADLPPMKEKPKVQSLALAHAVSNQNSPGVTKIQSRAEELKDLASKKAPISAALSKKSLSNDLNSEESIGQRNELAKINIRKSELEAADQPMKDEAKAKTKATEQAVLKAKVDTDAATARANMKKKAAKGMKNMKAC